MSEENKALVRRWLEEISKGNLALFDELFADCVYYASATGELKGQALKQFMASILAAFPDSRWTAEDQLAEGDKVATRWSFTGTHQGDFMGMPATGKRVTTSGMVIDRIADGKIVEEREEWDTLGLAQQMGAAPQPTEANKALARRFFDDFLNKREWALADEIFAADILYRGPHVPELRGPEAMKQLFTGLQGSFPDFRFPIEELISEGDKVVVRWSFTGTHKGEWMGIAPTGKPVSIVGTTTLRISGGKIVEHWADWDALGFFQQLGAVPPLGRAEDKAAA